jgi:two-component system LytT family response regulator
MISFDKGLSSERVPYTDIAWIAANENYTHVQVRECGPVLLKRPLADWAAILPEPMFQRLDRSLIVQLDGLVRTQRQSRDLMLLFFEGIAEPLPIGRAAAARLRELINA